MACAAATWCERRPKEACEGMSYVSPAPFSARGQSPVRCGSFSMGNSSFRRSSSFQVRSLGRAGAGNTRCTSPSTKYRCDAIKPAPHLHLGGRPHGSVSPGPSPGSKFRSVALPLKGVSFNWDKQPYGHQDRNTPPQSLSRAQSPSLAQQYLQSRGLSPTSQRRSPLSCQTPRARPGALDGGELQLNGPHFDPTRQPLRSQVLSRLGVPQTSLLEAMQGNCGGLNQGVWVVKDHTQKYVMKLVKGVNSFGMPTEGEKFVKIQNEHPGISDDPRLAFPVKIIRLMSPGQGKLYELIVMKKASGVQLSEYIATMRSENRMQQLQQILEQCGQFLAEFHACYGNKQHNDFTPSNIFYDPVNSRFTLIDLADMGPKIHEADAERFVNALNILSSCYGHQFFIEGKKCFEAGYNRLRR